jgi:hypothetical protein
MKGICFERFSREKNFPSRNPDTDLPTFILLFSMLKDLNLRFRAGFSLVLGCMVFRTLFIGLPFCYPEFSAAGPGIQLNFFV